jgi:purine-binding chemotaxis protein CheW
MKVLYYPMGMSDTDTALQLVTFRLGDERYGIDIMDVEGIVRIDEVRSIPNAPAYVEGIVNLRGEIIPVINLRRRFQIRQADLSDEDLLLSGFVIVNIDGQHLAIKIDMVSSVVTLASTDVQPPPQVISGIGAEYIQGVVSQDGTYLIILDAQRLFSTKELQQIERMQR